jgi:hypothetical protein
VVRALWDAESDHDAALWSKFAELGVCGALVPDAHGGMGLDERDLVLLLEETGRAALPAPVVASAAVGAPLLRDAGDAALASAWLPRVAAGDAILALGHPANPFVTDAGVADLLLLERDGEIHAIERSAATPTHNPPTIPRGASSASRGRRRRKHASPRATRHVRCSTWR